MRFYRAVLIVMFGLCLGLMGFTEWKKPTNPIHDALEFLGMFLAFVVVAGISVAAIIFATADTCKGRKDE